LAEQAPIRERAEEFIGNPNLVRNIISEGCEDAREVAVETLNEVRQAMGLTD
jgi:tryptophanyl-tRNA synthetase